MDKEVIQRVRACTCARAPTQRKREREFLHRTQFMELNCHRK